MPIEVQMPKPRDVPAASTSDPVSVTARRWSRNRR